MDRLFLYYWDNWSCALLNDAVSEVTDIILFQVRVLRLLSSCETVCSVSAVLVVSGEAARQVLVCERERHAGHFSRQKQRQPELLKRTQTAVKWTEADASKTVWCLRKMKEQPASRTPPTPLSISQQQLHTTKNNNNNNIVS